MVRKDACPDPSQLNGMLDGTLPPDDQTKVSLHLERCTECQTKFEELAREASVVPDGTFAPADRQESALLRVMEKLAGEGPETAAHGEPSDEPSQGEGPYLPFLIPSESPDYLGRLGPYNVVGVIGQGGMGIVLKAHDPRLNRFVAIKVLAPQLAAYAGARQRFLREAQAAAALNHDHIVTIHAVDEFNGFPYIVMQYVIGTSLAEQINQGKPFELKEVLRIGSQIAAGLPPAHAPGLVHRDIKPANILLETGGGRVRITDFGLARAVGEAQITQTGQITGTPEFMSPEQARGEWLDHRSDLFSLGCVLYAMCSGQSPFRAKTTWDAIGRVCNEQPRPLRELNPETPDWLETIVERLLAKKPDDRPQTALEVAEQLANSVPLLRGSSAGLGSLAGSVPLLRRSSAGPGSLAGTACQQAAVRRDEECGLAKKPETAACQASLSPPAAHRWKPRTIAAVALLVLLGGLGVFQIIIHIKNKDTGTETMLRVPKGSDVAIRGDKQVDVVLPSKEPPKQALSADMPKLLKRFDTAVKIITKDGITVEDDAWRIEAAQPRIVRLFEIADPGVEECTVLYRAKLKSESLEGRAFLEMWCRSPSGGEAFSKGLNSTVSGTTDWASYEIPFFLKRGESSDLIKLNVAIEGKGTFWIKDVELLKAPLRQDTKVGGNATELTQEGWMLWQKGEMAVAIPKFEQAVILAPDNQAAWNGLGWANFNSGNVEEAQKAFDKLIAINPDHPAAQNGLGQIFLLRRKYDEAESHLLKAAATPGASAAWYGLAKLYLLQGKFEDAEKWAEKIIRSGQADDAAKQMLQAAKDKKLSEEFRQMIEPPKAELDSESEPNDQAPRNTNP